MESVFGAVFGGNFLRGNGGEACFGITCSVSVLRWAANFHKSWAPTKGRSVEKNLDGMPSRQCFCLDVVPTCSNLQPL